MTILACRLLNGSSVRVSKSFTPFSGITEPDNLRLMRGRSRLARVVCHVVAAVQLLLPGATAWADARLEREADSPRGASHVEDHTSPQCPRAHSDDCVLCQHLTRPFARATPPALLPTHQYVVRVSVAERARPARAVSLALPESRAPPKTAVVSCQ
jgi:hypothetical protein